MPAPRQTFFGADQLIRPATGTQLAENYYPAGAEAECQPAPNQDAAPNRQYAADRPDVSHDRHNGVITRTLVSGVLLPQRCERGLGRGDAPDPSGATAARATGHQSRPLDDLLIGSVRFNEHEALQQALWSGVCIMRR